MDDSEVKARIINHDRIDVFYQPPDAWRGRA